MSKAESRVRGRVASGCQVFLWKHLFLPQGGKSFQEVFLKKLPFFSLLELDHVLAPREKSLAMWNRMPCMGLDSLSSNQWLGKIREKVSGSQPTISATLILLVELDWILDLMYLQLIYCIFTTVRLKDWILCSIYLAQWKEKWFLRLFFCLLLSARVW